MSSLINPLPPLQDVVIDIDFLFGNNNNQGLNLEAGSSTIVLSLFGNNFGNFNVINGLGVESLTVVGLFGANESIITDANKGHFLLGGGNDRLELRGDGYHVVNLGDGNDNLALLGGGDDIRGTLRADVTLGDGADTIRLFDGQGMVDETERVVLVRDFDPALGDQFIAFAYNLEYGTLGDTEMAGASGLDADTLVTILHSATDNNVTVVMVDEYSADEIHGAMLYVPPAQPVVAESDFHGL